MTRPSGAAVVRANGDDGAGGCSPTAARGGRVRVRCCRWALPTLLAQGVTLALLHTAASTPTSGAPLAPEAPRAPPASAPAPVAAHGIGMAKPGSAALAALLASCWFMGESYSDGGGAGGLAGGDPYATIGVTKDSGKAEVTKAYRTLAKRWHPDRKGGDSEAFTRLAHAYDVLTDPEKREIYDSLGEAGLRRLRDGDPSVKKQWRLDNPPKPLGALDLVTSKIVKFIQWSHKMRVALGLEAPVPAAYISASDHVGRQVMSGGATTKEQGAVTFKLQLTVFCSSRTKMLLRNIEDITHNCAAGAKFLGMKKTYYLTCPYQAGLLLAVSVKEDVFRDDGDVPNKASASFTVLML